MKYFGNWYYEVRDYNHVIYSSRWKGFPKEFIKYHLWNGFEIYIIWNEYIEIISKYFEINIIVNILIQVIQVYEYICEYSIELSCFEKDYLLGNMISGIWSMCAMCAKGWLNNQPSITWPI